MYKPLFALGFLSTLLACSDDAAVTADAGSDAGVDSAVVLPLQSISFEAMVGALPFSCSQAFASIGTTAASMSPTDFRLYVSEVFLTRNDGVKVPFALEPDGVFQSRDVALLDFEDRTGNCANGTEAMHTKLTGRAPAGTYTGVSFTLGVPDAINHQNVAAATPPLDLSALFWNWQGGYKFLRADGKAGASGASFVMHLGSTGCTAGADPNTYTCTNRNAGAVTLALDPFAGTIVADWKQLFASVAVDADKGGVPGCMSGATDPECAAIFPHVGVAANGSGSASTQDFFRVK